MPQPIRWLVLIAVWATIAVGAYVGLFLLGFAWLYHDIDDVPTPLTARLAWSALGAFVLAGTVVAGLFVVRRVRRWAPKAGPGPERRP